MKLILIVEDEYGNAEMLQMLFEAYGYRVAVASNGKLALERINEEKPSAILSDFMMPHMTGAELGAAVRRDAQLQDIPFVFMSGTSEEIVQREFCDYDAFVPKPFEIESLIRVVGIFVDRGRAPRPTTAEVDESMRHLLKGIQIPPIE